MYVLHYAPDNASLIVRLALEEAGLPYRSALVDRAARAQDSAAYRALNPTGLIPTLATPQGPISETAAILLWLSEAHPEAGLAPRPGSPLRLPFLKWLFFLSNTAHADLRQVFYPTKYVAPDAISGHAALAHARMWQHFGSDTGAVCRASRAGGVLRGTDALVRALSSKHGQMVRRRSLPGVAGHRPTA